jgi:hydroxypyruvate reductase
MNNPLSPERFATTSLKSCPAGPGITRILFASIQAVEPGAAVHKFLRRDGNRLTVVDREYDLASFERVFLVGCGKAGAPMAAAVYEILSDRVSGGVVIVKEGHAASIPGIEILEAGHPIPTQASVDSTNRLISYIQDAKPDDLVICVISGGGSALLTSPAEGITLDEVQSLTGQLLACGATIHEVNTVRKHIDVVKGGGLAALIAPALMITLVLSDVDGDPLDRIASGPTAPDPSTFLDAWHVFEQYDLLDKIPKSIFARVKGGLEGIIADTPKPGDPFFTNVQNVIVGSNRQAALAALHQAAAEGYHTMLLTTHLSGEARQVSGVLSAIGRQMVETGEPLGRPACIVAGGETTVTLRGKGRGGRNQEIALAAVSAIENLDRIVIVALGTDGGDGPTDAAGAVVTGETLKRALSANLDSAAYLANNDAYNFFDPLGDLLKPGPTLTNVNDLAFIFIYV